ncbi:hypothetical protein Tco_1334825 [Tanacetum coccineum]
MRQSTKARPLLQSEYELFYLPPAVSTDVAELKDMLHPGTWWSKADFEKLRKELTNGGDANSKAIMTKYNDSAYQIRIVIPASTSPGSLPTTTPC